MLHPSRRHLEAVIRDSEGKQISRCLIRRGRYVIGQERKCEIAVDEPSVSSRHARLTVVTDEEFYIEDLDSANGTLVDGVPASGMAPVSLQSKIELGAVRLEFQRASLPAAVFEHLPEGFLREHRYNFGEVVVSGTTSTIFEAYDTSLGRDIAIKVMLPAAQADATKVLRFIREAQITSQLQHPNILPVYELNLDKQSQLFFTTRFVEGESLTTVLEALVARDYRAIARHPLGRLLVIFQKACDAVACAHVHGVVHTGLRPDAITIGRFGEAFVINWGQARILSQDDPAGPFEHHIRAAAPTTSPALSAGSAPEQLSEEDGPITPRTDVYALGAILYRMLCLAPPLAEDDEDKLRSAIRGGYFASAQSRAPKELPHCPDGKMPEALVAIADKALSPKPEDRWPSVAALQAAVSEWQDRHARPVVVARAHAVARH